MQLTELPASPPAPEQVITPWSDSPGQDLLGLRAPAERIALGLMNGVTTISPLVRYLGFRSWVIRRYLDLGGPDERNTFNAFAGKCEAALVLGHKLAGLPTLRMVGADRATEELAGSSALVAKPLTKILAMDTYAGPSQDLGLAMRRRPVPSLSKERGLPLAEEVNGILESSPALMGLEASTVEQALNPQHAVDLATVFPISAPVGTEREMLIDAVCPPRPRAGERARLAAYSLLLHLATPAGAPALEEEVVFRAAIRGGGPTLPPVLAGVCDGWVKFLVRDILVATHERTVAVVLGFLAEEPNRSASADALTRRIEQLDPNPVLTDLGLSGVDAGTPVRDLYDLVTSVCGDRSTYNGLSRWLGGFDELAIFEALRRNPEPDVVSLLPVAWILAVLRTGDSLSDGTQSIDRQSGALRARLGLQDVIMPTVQSWRNSSEPVGRVIARLARRSVDQHLLIAWHRMQADPRRNVALLVSDGTVWTGESTLRAGRATSRLYQAISWLQQLGLISKDGVTSDGTALLDRGLKVLNAVEVTP